MIRLPRRLILIGTMVEMAFVSRVNVNLLTVLALWIWFQLLGGLFGMNGLPS
jgi:hypothetical protein